MKKVFISFMSLAFVAAISSCKKDDNGGTESFFKIFEPDGTEVSYRVNNVSLGLAGANDNYDYYRIGGTTALVPDTNSGVLNDTLLYRYQQPIQDIRIYFYDAEPTDGAYPITTGRYSVNDLTAGKATLALDATYYSYRPTDNGTAKIKVNTINGKREITFENIAIEAIQVGSNHLPAGSKITGVIVEP